jgi:EAL and modified HD-GYP domain-containing signal transduction protein
MSFLSHFFGGSKEEPWYSPENLDRNGSPLRFKTAPPADASSQRNTGSDAGADTIVVREEIVDARHRLCGYRFIPKALVERRPYPEPHFFEALREERIADFAQRRTAVIPISPDGIVFGRHQALTAPHTFFQIDVRQSPLPQEDLVGRLAALRGSGARTALRGIGLPEELGPLLQETDMLFLDLSGYLMPQLQKIVQELRTAFPSLALTAEGVRSWAEQRMCTSWGFQFCLGDFLSSRDEEEEEGRLNDSQLASMELLNLLRRDAELAELAAVAKRDPGLTFHLLKWANSPATGLSTVVTSVNQAIMVLGRAQMVRWLMVAMFRMGGKHERDESLLEIALIRARCLEMLEAPALTQEERDELFLVGLLSLFDILLNMPMPKILAQMHLADRVTEVLLRSAGPHAPYLMLALAMEKGRVEQAADLAARLGIPPGSLEPTRSAAFLWAQDALGIGLMD